MKSKRKRASVSKYRRRKHGNIVTAPVNPGAGIAIRHFSIAKAEAHILDTYRKQFKLEPGHLIKKTANLNAARVAAGGKFEWKDEGVWHTFHFK